MPLMTTPAAVYAVPSAVNPGCSPRNPRSTTSSMVVSASSDQSAGAAPVTRNQVVPHGAPQALPIATGAYACAAASLNGTGSPGAVHAVIVTGLVAR